MAARGGWNESEMNESLLMQENQRRTENLSSKVNLLKSFAIDIDKETKEQNRYLDNMQSTFDSTGGLLGGTLARVFGIHKNTTTNRRCMCYLIVGIVGGFIVFYYIIARIVSSFSSSSKT